MKRPFILLATGALAAIALTPGAALVAAGPAASQWALGPIIKGRNYSVNMPPTLSVGRDGAFFDFPYPTAAAGHVHYVTLPVHSLESARRMTLRYRIDAERGVRFVPQEVPDATATLSLYFQRAGDGWTRKYPTYRWYSPGTRVVPLTSGEHEISIAFDEPWTAMMGGDNRDQPGGYAAALAQTAHVGFVFGSNGGRGHGVYATGPARFTVLDFRIE